MLAMESRPVDIPKPNVSASYQQSNNGTMVRFPESPAINKPRKRTRKASYSVPVLTPVMSPSAADDDTVEAPSIPPKLNSTKSDDHMERDPKRRNTLLPNRKKLLLIGDTDPVDCHINSKFDFIHCTLARARKVKIWKQVDVLLLVLGSKERLFEFVAKSRKLCKITCLVCVIHSSAGESAEFRERILSLGANMITNDNHALKRVLDLVACASSPQLLWHKNSDASYTTSSRGSIYNFKDMRLPSEDESSAAGGATVYLDDQIESLLVNVDDQTYSCPYCNCEDLTEDQLWHHIPLFHTNPEHNNHGISCPICQGRFETKRHFWSHMNHRHGPNSRRPYDKMVPTHAFSLVVCRRPKDKKFLMIQESISGDFWLPGGHVRPGETLLETANRLVETEAGIKVEIKGVLKIEHSTYVLDEASHNFNRMRVVFYAEPKKNKELPKSIPTYDSAGATWMALDEIDKIPLRSNDAKEWFLSLSTNRKYYPLDVLSCWKHDYRGNNNGFSAQDLTPNAIASNRFIENYKSRARAESSGSAASPSSRGNSSSNQSLFSPNQIALIDIASGVSKSTKGEIDDDLIMRQGSEVCDEDDNELPAGMPSLNLHSSDSCRSDRDGSHVMHVQPDNLSFYSLGSKNSDNTPEEILTKENIETMVAVEEKSIRRKSKSRRRKIRRGLSAILGRPRSQSPSQNRLRGPPKRSKTTKSHMSSNEMRRGAMAKNRKQKAQSDTLHLLGNKHRDANMASTPNTTPGGITPQGVTPADMTPAAVTPNHRRRQSCESDDSIDLHKTEDEERREQEEQERMYNMRRMQAGDPNRIEFDTEAANFQRPSLDRETHGVRSSPISSAVPSLQKSGSDKSNRSSKSNPASPYYTEMRQQRHRMKGSPRKMRMTSPPVHMKQTPQIQAPRLLRRVTQEDVYHNPHVYQPPAPNVFSPRRQYTVPLYPPNQPPASQVVHPNWVVANPHPSAPAAPAGYYQPRTSLPANTVLPYAAGDYVYRREAVVPVQRASGRQSGTYALVQPNALPRPYLKNFPRSNPQSQLHQPVPIGTSKSTTVSPRDLPSNQAQRGKQEQIRRRRSQSSCSQHAIPKEITQQSPEIAKDALVQARRYQASIYRSPQQKQHHRVVLS